MSHDFLMGMISKGGAFIVGAVLKSIQQVTKNIAVVDSEQTLTISSVDPAKTFLIRGGYESAASTTEKALHTVRLIDATTLGFYIEGHLGSQTDSWVTVVEFESGVTVQRGITALLAGDQDETVTINPVDLTKAFVTHLGVRTEETVPKNHLAIVRLADATRLYVQNPNHNAGDQQVSWEVVEFE